MTPSMKRRGFLKGAAGGLTLLAGGSLKAAPSEQIRIGVIGVRGRGESLARGFAAMPEAVVTHVCDVDASVLPTVAKRVAEAQDGKEPKAEKDMQALFADKSIDAVAIATPDHWHALAAIRACQAGKHVYVEKPASHTLWEGRQMLAAARKYNRVVQVGTQSRSAPHYVAMVEALRSGRIGKIHAGKAWNSQRRPDLAPKPDEAPPPGLDHNLWLGPAPARPFNTNRFHYTWHWNWDYGTGDMGNDGIHQLDLVRWGLGVAKPTNIAGFGARLENKNWETPDSLYITFSFPESEAVLVYEQRDWSPYFQDGFENGIAFYGTEGCIIGGPTGWRIIEPGNKEVPSEKVTLSDEPHRQDFLKCVKEGGRPHADIEEGHHSAMLAHLGNIMFRAGRCLKFDPQKEEIVGDTEAAALTRRTYREPFVIPDEV